MTARPSAPTRSRALDLAPAGVAAGAGLWWELSFHAGPRLLALPVLMSGVLQVGAAAVLCLRRQAPSVVAGAVGAAALLVPPAAAFVAMFTAAVHVRTVPRAAAAATVVLVGWLLGALPARTDPYTAPALLVACFLLGLWIRTRRVLLAELLAQAEQAAAERDRRARLTTAQDQARVRAEVFDRVSTWVNRTVEQAAELAAGSEDAHVGRVAADIGEKGRRALTELDRLLDRTWSSAHQPELAELIDQARSSGVRIRLTPGFADAVPDTMTGLVYRVIREAVTNAARHAPGCRLEASIQPGPPTVIEVRNSPGSAPGLSSGTGSGLAALRTQLRAAGGQLEAGHTADGGFQVRVCLPTPATHGHVATCPARRDGSNSPSAGS